MGSVDANAWPFLWVCIPIVVGGAPLGAICGSYLPRLTLACLVYFMDAAQLIGVLAVVGCEPWPGEADGGNTATPLHLCLTSAALPCNGKKDGNRKQN